jgi:lipopolysaccharide transport system ATP-binding protein
MSDTVISIENVSKSYRLGAIGTGTFKGDLKQWWARQRGKPDPYQIIGDVDHGNRQGEILWALKDINLHIQQGDILGIVGRNGAGKSTLLKILSEVTAPTSGEVKIKGRIASLLEVGTGFHPDLTGRENTYLNGAILGMSRQEVRRKFDEIVDFAGIENFIDTPVKRYSSGMYVRLAFAVAAHLEPEILIVDEVLAVGDAAFQKKCLGKMGNVAKEGRTVLFVSHNMIAIQSLCQSAIWMDAGQLKAQGTVRDIVNAYLQSGMGGNDANERLWPDIASAPGNETVRLHRISVQPEAGKAGDVISMQKPLRIEVDYWNLLPSVHLHAALHIFNGGILLFSTGALNEPELDLHVKPPLGLFRSVCHIPGNLLNSGYHRVDLLFIRLDSPTTYVMEEAINFDVADNKERAIAWYGNSPGVMHPELPWETEYLGNKDGKIPSTTP